jgi:peptide-methionine (S)-S-oxide reductase
MRYWVLGIVAAPLAALLWMASASGGEKPVIVPAPALDEKSLQDGASEKAVLAGGCFWGVQAVFQHVKGVQQVLSGYSGGSQRDAQYEIVSSGRTGHAESVEITFDPKLVSYGTLLQVYFSVAHNPTELDRQGPDVGKQYRSIIFVRSTEQRRVAEAYIAQIDKARAFESPIVTKVDDFKAFYPAESYHQDYATRHPNEPYIAVHDRPKVEHLKRLFPRLARGEPVLVNGSAPKS